MIATKFLICVGADVQNTQAALINLFHAIDVSQAKFEDSPAFLWQLSHPLGHFHKSYCAAGLNHNTTSWLLFRFSFLISSFWICKLNDALSTTQKEESNCKKKHAGND